MFRLITIEREYGCGGGAIAAELAQRLGWKLWDHLLTEEIARLANVDLSAVTRCDERMDSRFYRLAKDFLARQLRAQLSAGKSGFRYRPHDGDDGADRSQNRPGRKCRSGRSRRAVFSARAARRLSRFSLRAARRKTSPPAQDGTARSEAEDMVDTVDRERIAFVKHYFDADWPTRSLYHVMINTAVGNEAVIETILDTMHLVEGRPKATDYERPKSLACAV